MSVTYSEKHPHEPEIPPVLDAEGRCLVCRLQHEREILLRGYRQACCIAAQHSFRGKDVSLGEETDRWVRDVAEMINAPELADLAAIDREATRTTP